jgi:hypothetical protein
MFNVPWNSYRQLFPNSFKPSILPCENVGNAKVLINQARNLASRVNGTGKRGYISAEAVPKGVHHPFHSLLGEGKMLYDPANGVQDPGSIFDLAESALCDFSGDGDIASRINMIIEIKRARLCTGYLQECHHDCYVFAR